MIQLVALGCREYIWGHSWAWNWLDLFVVTSSWVELVVDTVSSGESTSRSNSSFRLMRTGDHRRRSSHRHGKSRKRSRTSSSSSSSSSRKKELKELRAYKAQVEQEKLCAQQKAEAAAAEQARKQELDELEQRMIRAISAITPHSQPDASSPVVPSNHVDEPPECLSPKSCRLLEARTDDLVSVAKGTTWPQVREQLEKIPKAKLKALLQHRGLTPLPRSESKKVDKLFAYLKNQCSE
eukprot:Skav200381  [mRNA]  locus=scaffold2518:404385:405540:- [translate_table: standard]